MSSEENFRKQVKALYHRIILLFCGIGIIFIGALYLQQRTSGIPKLDTPEESILLKIPSEELQIENGIHTPTGFKNGTGLTQVIQNCTNCHSSALVIQNKMSREAWGSTIKWMQETQNLWDLGEDEAIILDYLATYYAPDQKGRRENLSDVDWYELK
ncbi:monoheme cytochrome C [Spongiimicrobium salis]|uniref:monoheme cytochrome C n=1 Tax=Spongiimicrobium salis TaxID=1667022 RepID=UPI00374CDD06